MTIEQLEERRQLLIGTLNQNNLLLQGHLQEIEFQISEIKKAEAQEETPVASTDTFDVQS